MSLESFVLCSLIGVEVHRQAVCKCYQGHWFGLATVFTCKYHKTCVETQCHKLCNEKTSTKPLQRRAKWPQSDRTTEVTQSNHIFMKSTLWREQKWPQSDYLAKPLLYMRSKKLPKCNYIRSYWNIYNLFVIHLLHWVNSWIKEVSLVNVLKLAFYFLSNLCPHAGSPLALFSSKELR